MFALRDYQEKAVESLKEKANHLLRSHKPKTLVFKAPTGAGKTIMLAEFLKRFVENREDDLRFAFVWAAPRQLHLQSKQKLESYYFDDKALHCILFDDIAEKQIGDAEILFLNWESINREDGNVMIRENERDFNLSTVLENTRDSDRIVILIIDESHFAAKTTRAFELIASTIGPKLTIEASATPKMTGDDNVNIQREDVIKEGMIKKLVSINPGFHNEILHGLTTQIKSMATESTDEFVLRMAIQKREHLKAILEDIGALVNPLLLIQLPNDDHSEIAKKDEIVSLLRHSDNITVENGKLAIYLSKDKQNLEGITRNDCEVEVMIFKEAIAIGWDCPRAAILVAFREWKSFSFSVQTLGRILRMPELKHYDNDELNAGYVFTNISDLSIDPDFADQISAYQSKRRENYTPIDLRSVSAKRFREETRLSPEFIYAFFEAADECGLKGQINIGVSGVGKELLTDAFLENTDESIASLIEPHTETSYGGATAQRRMTAKEVQRIFDVTIGSWLKPEYFPEQRSVGKLKEAMQKWLKDTFPMQVQFGDLHSQYVILNKVNSSYVKDAVTRAKALYAAKVGKGKRDFNVKDDWGVGAVEDYGANYHPLPMTKCVMTTFYQRTDASEPEKKFALFLDRELEGVDWWHKNGDSGAQHFAVKYADQYGNEHTFYVDWIVLFQDGRIGLFDTKSGIYAKDAKHRAESLAAYIKEENAKGKRLVGGVVQLRGDTWLYNNKEIYEFNPNDWSDWETVRRLGTGFHLLPE